MRTISHRAPAPRRRDIATTWVRAGHAEDWLELCRTRFAETRRVVGARSSSAKGTAVEAAELYAHIAGPEDEAVVRLLAAEQLVEAGRRAEADVQLAAGARVLPRGRGASRRHPRRAG